MSRAEAYEVLGLKPNASDEEIVAAHRKLMQKIHPDFTQESIRLKTD